MADKKQSSPGIFDIAKPGKGGLPASSSGRPIIVSNRPLMRDPMMAEPQPDDDPAPVETAQAAKPSQKLVIEPLHGDTQPEPAPESVPEPVPDVAVKPEDIPGVPQASEEREVDTELARKHAARLQKMIEEEEYFLPIKTVEERRSRKVAIFGILLILVLAAAWYNTALDAGLLPNTYNLPHTSFFTVK
jgi:hypothetical protein